MVSVAESKDRNNLINLWREAFLEESCALYFYDIVPFEDIFVWREGRNNDGERAAEETSAAAVAMLHFLPCSFRCETGIYRGAYLYALATSASFRKRGIMGRLIEAAKTRAKKDGLDFLCLAAADRSLCGYYETFGFRLISEEKMAHLGFHENIEEFVRWERMQEPETENTIDKEKLLENQMILELRQIPSVRFFGAIPY